MHGYLFIFRGVDKLGLSTEHVYDKVTVNGVQYSGSTGPDGVVASSMTWWSDGSVVRDGCGRSAKPN